MMGLQEWIHKLEEGDGVKYVKIGTLLLGLLGLLAIYDLREYKNYSNPEAMEAAQLARNIARGQGYTTQCVRPLAFYLLNQKDPGTKWLEKPTPDVSTPPVYPVLLAGLMKVMPMQYTIINPSMFVNFQPERIISFMNQAFFLAAIYLVFLLGRRLFDPQVGWIAGAIFACTDLFWRFSVSGLSTNLLILIFLGIVWCLVHVVSRFDAETPGAVPVEGAAAVPDAPAAIRVGPLVTLAALSGGLVALGCLTQYAFGWLILPLIGFYLIFFGRFRVVLAGVACLVFLGLISPWILRNAHLTGNFFGTAGYTVMMDTPRFLEGTIEKSITTDFKEFEVDEYVRKLVVNGEEIFLTGLPKLGGSWITAFFAVGLLVPFRSLVLRRVRVFMLLSMATLFVVQALGKTYLSKMNPEVNSENLFALVAPVAFIFGSAMFSMLLDGVEFPFPRLKVLSVWGFCALCSGGMILKLMPPRESPLAFPPYLPPHIQVFSEWMRADELMMSDVPWAVAWYGDKKCLWTTLDLENGFYRINDYNTPIKAIYLTPLTTDQKYLSEMQRGVDAEWGKFFVDGVMKTNLPTGFPLQHAPYGFLPDQLFLTDRARWRGRAFGPNK